MSQCGVFAWESPGDSIELPESQLAECDTQEMMVLTIASMGIKSNKTVLTGARIPGFAF